MRYYKSHILKKFMYSIHIKSHLNCFWEVKDILFYKKNYFISNWNLWKKKRGKKSMNLALILNLT